MPRRVSMNVYIVLFIGLVMANLSIYKAIYETPHVAVRVIPAGKSTVVLIRTPRDGVLLVDTGTDASILRALGSALPMWQRHVDALILTSADSKSSGGLKEVTSRYRADRLIRFGARADETVPTVPYGTTYDFDTDTRISIIGPRTISLSYGAATLQISSTTPPGVYRSDGTGFQK